MGQNQVKTDKEAAKTTPVLMDDCTKKDPPTEIPFPLHRAAYFGDLEKVRELLTTVTQGSAEPLTRRQDNAKMTPLHHATLGANPKSADICTLLLQADHADQLCTGKEPLVNATDAKGKTPLHYAAASKQPGLVDLLIQLGADPNIKDHDGLAPLHICAEGNSDAAIECARILLSSPNIIPYDPCGPNRSCRTVMHIAANYTASKMLNFLWNKGFDHSKKDNRGLTPLMLAASARDTDEAVKCVEILLKACTVEEINAKSDDNHQTALMMAAFRSHQKVMQAFVKNNKTDLFATDSQRRTALHWAVEAWFRTNSLACVKLLLESEQLNDWDKKQLYLYGTKDNKGEAPIDIAIRNHSIRITEYLVTAHPTPEAWLKDDLLEKIYSKLPEAMVPLMNQSLKYNPAKFHERNEEIDVEFGTITGYTDPVMDEPKPETLFLRHIMNAPKEIQRTMFLHPLVQLFLDLKWRKVRWLTRIGIILQVLWLAMYTSMILEIYIPNCPNEGHNETSHVVDDSGSGEKKKSLKLFLSLGFARRDESSKKTHKKRLLLPQRNKMKSQFRDLSCSACYLRNLQLFCELCHCHGAAQGFAFVLYILSLIVIVKEVFQMRNSVYFKDMTNYAQLLVLLISFINSIPAWQSTSDVPKVHAYLAAFGIFIAWVLSLREVGKFPQCGIYAAILKKVLWHCLKMMVFYFPLLVAFAMCLRILVPGKGQYTYLFFAIVKVVIMMTGELDFEDAFYEDEGPSLAVSAILGQFFFLLLVSITTIVLLNLLTGLAVNDVQSLIEEAEVNRLSNELEQIYLLESLILWVRHNVIGMERWTDLLYSCNVTTEKYPDYSCFSSRQPNVETKSYPQDLKLRIRQNMVPAEED